MKYTITGITGTRNRGVEALLVTTISQVRRRDPSAKFTVLTADRTYDAHRCETTGVTLMDQSLPLFSSAGRGVRGLLRLAIRRSGHRWRRLVAALRETDCVIASGGDIFGSEYGAESLDLNLAVLRLAVKLGRPIVFLGHSIGPFRAPEELMAWEEVASRSVLITLRESLSNDYVRTHCSLPQTKVARTADVAFLLRPADTGEQLLAGLGLTPMRPTIACAVSRGISRYAGVDAASHFKTWRECIEHLAVRLGFQVLLIPHVQDRHPGNDDAILGTDLLREVSPDARKRTRLAAGDFCAAEYKALIGRCELVIAERMHAGIAGLSSGVATMIVGYSVKAQGILSDILGSQVNEDGLLVPIESFSHGARVIQGITHVLEQRRRIALQLQEGRAAVERAAQENFDLLQEAIGVQGA